MPRKKKADVTANTITKEESGSGAPPLSGLEPVDVFLCFFEERPFHGEVLDSWEELEEAGLINLKIITSKSMAAILEQTGTAAPILDLDVDGNEFQRRRRIIAELEANTPIYVVADDDCIIKERDFKNTLSLMVNGGPVENYEAFAILAPFPDNANINPWTPEEEEYDGWPAINDEYVMEHVDVGWIRFTRKGVMPDDANAWMPTATNKYDRLHAGQIRSRGYRVGLVKGCYFHHLGEINPIPQVKVGGDVE